ncbi:hypothetical protein BC941DRAFT_497942 [Chlamydoabsidia padenii]|nr:hypothetical protein BC941DRAFT_497942 [Chlamydoabsidia padenii]
MGKSKASSSSSSSITSKAETATLTRSESVTKQSSSTRPSISTGVIFKLLGFSALLFAGPIGTYFYSIDALFNGNTTYAAGAAALVANLVVIAYILTAMMEDMKTDKADKED